MTRSLVIYASKYGATKEVAEAVAAGLGAEAVTVESNPDLGAFELIVLGSPIYAGEYLAAVSQYIEENRDQLKTKKIAAFITAAADHSAPVGLTGDEDEEIFTQQEYADGLANLAGGEVLGTKGFGGRLVPNGLDSQDFNTLSWFYRFLMHAPLEGFDLIDTEKAIAWGKDLRAKLGD